MPEQKEYFLGLDIGTNSVGYAVTDPEYNLLKFKGEPMWGTHLFAKGEDCEERRTHRTARRRLDRRQQRVSLVGDLFAKEIAKIDPNFFARRNESALHKNDRKYNVNLFDGPGITDKEYHENYPTVHHLILDLMTSDEPHDVRLVYTACAWLVAHRGHFLFDIDPDKTEELLDFSSVYEDFRAYLEEDLRCRMPWNEMVEPKDILKILQMRAGVAKKKELFKKDICGGKKPDKKGTDDPYSIDAVVTLLSGGKVKPKDLFGKEDYAELESISLEMDEEEFDKAVAELDEDGEFLIKLRALYSCAMLITTMANCREGDQMCISSSKVATYEQHKHDLERLKLFAKKYCSETVYENIFMNATADNYVAYSGNTRRCKDWKKVKKVKKNDFSTFLKNNLKGLTVEEEDQEFYNEMMERLDSCSFLPKQRETDNRVIPQQLYRQELVALLRRASGYLPMLNEQDEDGLTVMEKIISVFDFRIPYYVGPLSKTDDNHAWIVRKKGNIYPWNFDKMVDLDASEQAFINEMTGNCTYLPGEKVLPVHSLLYEKFMVLNELNNLKVNGRPITPEAKQSLVTELFMEIPKVTAKMIRNHLLKHGMENGDLISGIDTTFKSSLKSYHIFKRMLVNGILTEADAEDIIFHAAHTEDKGRMRHWLKTTYPKLTDDDVSYILRQKLKEFGRLSARLLTGLYGTETDSDGEAFTIMEALWNTNSNLMQLLSDKYTFVDQIHEFREEYYAEHPRTLNKLLEEMYVPNGARRSIYRTLDIVSDVVKATGTAPKKIFLEMARGTTEDKKGKRTDSRKTQLLKLYEEIRTEEAKKLAEELETRTDNELQEKQLFLYYLQMGRSAYTGAPIDLTKLWDGKTYNIDHIYPRSQVKDDSLLNNLVLVESSINGTKDNNYPVDGKIRERMAATWHQWHKDKLMNDEKYYRLTRSTPFSTDEKWGFINRQLVETRQSTKAIKTILNNRFPKTEIVCVKAGLVSEFRQEFKMLKCRTVNDLHHAKDAFLNIVVGNVYDERFSKQWFRIDEEEYSVKTKVLFGHKQSHGKAIYWRGGSDIDRVKKTMGKNAVHLTRFSYYRHGKLFKQPEKAKEGLVPRKKDLPTERYGGYNSPAIGGFMLARFDVKGKKEVMLVAVEIMYLERLQNDSAFVFGYIEDQVEKITGKKPENLEILLNGRVLKIHTAFSLDGTKMTLSGKTGEQVRFSPLAALNLPYELEQYAKKLESFQNKKEKNKALLVDEERDGISPKQNIELYKKLTEKMQKRPFAQYPGNQHNTLASGEGKFEEASAENQVACLINIMTLLKDSSDGKNLTTCGGAPHAGTKKISAKISNWKKQYTSVRIIDESASGLFSNDKTSINLLDLL